MFRYRTAVLDEGIVGLMASHYKVSRQGQAEQLLRRLEKKSGLSSSVLSLRPLGRFMCVVCHQTQVRLCSYKLVRRVLSLKLTRSKKH